jgi:thiamine biosynthesis lipoprotein
MLHKLEFHAMGCEMSAVLDSPTRPAELDQLPAWFEAWEQTFSRFRLDSELSQANRRAGLPTRVSAEFAEVFELACSAEQASGGLVTPVLLDALLRAGYDRSFEMLPGPPLFPALLEQSLAAGLAQVQWDPATRTLCLPEGLHLDFGGLVKGWSASRAAARLEKFGPVLVEAGGDIAIRGRMTSGDYWPVGIAAPYQAAEHVALLKLETCGVATSGKDHRRWLQNGSLRHHLIDPRTGLPAQNDMLTATVIAPDSIQAEWAAKTCLLLGQQEGLAWLNAHPAFAGLLVLEDGRYCYSQNFENYLWS